jgi:hypothetical protein
MRRLLLAMLVGSVCLGAQQSQVRTSFRVTYVAEGDVYLDAGRKAGLSEGMKLSVRRAAAAGAPAAATTAAAGQPDAPPNPAPAGQTPAPAPDGDVTPPLAELVVTAVADTSAVCQVKSSHGELRVGDTAELSPEDAQTVQMVTSATHARKYAQVVSFTEGDPLDAEARARVPHPPSPEINRVRGRIGFEYNAIRDRNTGLFSGQEGLVFRADMTRLGGSYWNLTGFWRGRLNSSSGGTAEQQTIYDLINRTYHLTLYYDNPKSAWVAGFGRFYLPWAASLDTIDGGYFGRRLGEHTTAGIFAGSTPDPTSWNYNPNRQMVGTFINYAGGSFQSVRYSSTTGVAMSRINWRPERQYAFFENSVFYKNYLSIYHSLEVDDYRTPQTPSQKGPGVSRSFLTLRIQPVKYLSFDFNHNYFQTVPTFDPRLVGTGLLDKLLFQGLSAGVRVELPYRVSLYTELGRSSASGDAKRSLNQMYGVTLGKIWRTGIRADARFSRFDSSFGSGTYRVLILSRQMGEMLRLDLQVGQQNYVSTLAAPDKSFFVTGDVDYSISRHYFLGGGVTTYQGKVQNYDQVYFNMGYRF